MAAARKRTTKGKAKPKKRATAKAERPAPKRSDAKPPLERMDAAWRSLIETAVEQHHGATSMAEPMPKDKKSAKKKAK